MTMQIICLSSNEVSRLSALEEKVKQGQQTFIEVGNALAEIRESRLYRTTHSTFEFYCRERWGWSKSAANYYISAAGVAANLTTTVVTPAPTSERQVRPLTKLDDKEDQHAAWCRANEIANDESAPVTAAIVEKAVNEVISEKDNRPATGATAPVIDAKEASERKKAFGLSQQAINALGAIPANNAFRKSAIDDVGRWIKFNR